MQAKLYHAVIIAAVTLWAQGAIAESTQVMLSACRPIAKAEVVEDRVRFEQDFRTGLCWGAFAAVQGVIRQIDQHGQVLYSVCAPAESTRTQLVAIFMAYAEKNPQRMHEEFIDVAINSLQASFPCKAGR